MDDAPRSVGPAEDLVTRFLGTPQCAPQVGRVDTEDCRCRYENGDGTATHDCTLCLGSGSIEVPATCPDCGEESESAGHVGCVARECAYCSAPVAVTEPERRCERCAAEIERAEARERRAEDWAAWGDSRRAEQRDEGGR